MKLIIAILVTICLANAVPLPKESIDLVQIPLKNDKELDVLTLAEGDGTINERNKRTIGILRELFPQLSKVGAEVEEIDVLEPSAAGSDTILDTIRVAREINNLNNNQENEINKAPAADAEKTDQDVQSSDKADQKAEAAESPAFDELTLDSLEDDKSHDKRFLSFGGGGAADGGDGHATGGSGGGSGNFLFDIIRLVSGSSGSEQQDARNNDVDGEHSSDEHGHKGDGYTEGIPGPVTRLFVLANRGLSNLIQDLILRLAQTSERVVNFKARLITALI